MLLGIARPGRAAFGKHAIDFLELRRSQRDLDGLEIRNLAIQKALSPTSSINPTTVVNALRSEIKASLSSEALL